MYGVAGLQTKGMAGYFAQHLEERTAGFILHAITSPYPYVLVVMSGMGLLLFQTGLQRGRASIVIPVSNVVGSVYLVMTGTIVFDESLPADPLRLALRVAGFAVAIVIVAFMPQRDTETEIETARLPARPEAAPGTGAPRGVNTHRRGRWSAVVDRARYSVPDRSEQ
jgi:hypothetical protein